MVITGKVRNGVVVLDEGFSLPEGTRVYVTLASEAETGNWVEFPLVDSSAPGTVELTNERIAELFAEEDSAQ
jgi:hypothetical protein